MAKLSPRRQASTRAKFFGTYTYPGKSAAEMAVCAPATAENRIAAAM
jgi:hypothetical protein